MAQPGYAPSPFRRLFVDHMVAGTSRVWWQMRPDFVDPTPHTFQLQAGYTGNPNATDWVDVGSPATNTFFADDDRQRMYGKVLLTHYRVKLTTAVAVYMSEPVACTGILPERDWLHYREIWRKEVLRNGLVANQGILLKRLRYGVRCDECRDELTDEIQDSKCPQCNGVGFKVGYHAPMTLQFWSLEPESINELRNSDQAPGGSRPAMVTARVLGAPMLSREDVWVDQHTDQRYFIHEIKHLAEIRGVPLIMQPTLRLAAFSDAVYRVQVGGEPPTRVEPTLPTVGCGAVNVDHDYDGADELAYKDADGCGILGATILAFKKSDYENGLRTAAHAVGSSTTLANGRWSYAMLLDPGLYILVFEKTGEYGPDVSHLTVEGILRNAEGSSISSFSEPSFSV